MQGNAGVVVIERRSKDARLDKSQLKAAPTGTKKPRIMQSTRVKTDLIVGSFV